LLDYSNVETIKKLEDCLNEKGCVKIFVHVNSIDMYLLIVDFVTASGCDKIANSVITTILT
jgi:hypothetical protein